MLEVNNITIERKGNLLYKNLSFKVEPGKLLHLKGMNGSGKSSLLQALIGDLRPKEGEVLVDGKMVKSAREIAREFGYLPQELWRSKRIARIFYRCKTRRFKKK